MRQNERRARTKAAIIAAATEHFGQKGFGETTIDEIALAAKVAKGAVYHHYVSKQALFEAVFDEVSSRLAAELASRKPRNSATIEPLIDATKGYFELCAIPSTTQITLRDAPGVLGYERWKELDAKHFGGLVAFGLDAAMKAGVLREQPVEPLAKMFLAAIQAAALECAVQDDFERAAQPYLAVMTTMLEGLKAPAMDSGSRAKT